MDEKISPTDLAKVFKVSRQYIYSAGRNEWTAADVRAYARQLVIDAEAEAETILSRLRHYNQMVEAQKNLDGTATPAASPTEG